MNVISQPTFLCGLLHINTLFVTNKAFGKSKNEILIEEYLFAASAGHFKSENEIPTAAFNGCPLKEYLLAACLGHSNFKSEMSTTKQIQKAI